MKRNIFKAYDMLMRYLHTLNVHSVRLHNVHYALQQSKSKQLDKPGQDSRVAICYNNLQLLTGGKLSEYQLYRLNTSEETSKSQELWFQS